LKPLTARYEETSVSKCHKEAIQYRRTCGTLARGKKEMGALEKNVGHRPDRDEVVDFRTTNSVPI